MIVCLIYGSISTVFAPQAFKKSEEAKKRLVESYELMLGFYGIQLVNRETGEVKRAENWKERFGNLERYIKNSHASKFPRYAFLFCNFGLICLISGICTTIFASLVS